MKVLQPFALLLTIIVLTSCSQLDNSKDLGLKPQFGTAQSDKATDVALNDSGHLYTVGDFWKRGFVQRYSRTGTLLWQRTFNPLGSGIPGSYTYTTHLAEVDPDGNVYIGVANADEGLDNLLTYNQHGAQRWVKQLGGSIFGLAVDATSNVFVAWGANQGHVTKFNASGTKVWQRSHLAYPIAIAVSPNGNVHVVRDDGIITKYSTGGMPLWSKAGSFRRGELPDYDPVHFEIVTGVNEEIFVLIRLFAEIYDIGCDCFTHDGYLYLHKFDKTGGRKWTRRVVHEGDPSSYPGGESWGVPNLGLDSDTFGNAFLAWPAPSTGSGSNRNAFFAKYTRLGQQAWRKEFGTARDDGALSVATYDGSEVYTSGYTSGNLTEPNKGFDDAFIRKTDGVGNRLWTR